MKNLTEGNRIIVWTPNGCTPAEFKNYKGKKNQRAVVIYDVNVTLPDGEIEWQLGRTPFAIMSSDIIRREH